MLTVNADAHPVMRRFHRPGEEKRMVVIVEPRDHGRWLTCKVEEASAFFTAWDGALQAAPAPLPPRAPRAGSARSRGTGAGEDAAAPPVQRPNTSRYDT
jgi:putative SOS response-associated peptidase YedK